MIHLVNRNYKKVFYILLIIYFVINIFYLTRFPFIHSDEPWLSGLSRNILEKESFSVTETFFDLKERHPHAIKILFHSIQIVFIKLFGYGIFSVRLVSLLFSILTLFFFYKLSALIFESDKAAILCTLFLGLDVQYIYASHFARQEIIILFVLVFTLHFFLAHIDHKKALHNVIIGTILGLSIGIHPNSFIISLPFGFIYIYHILVTKKLKFFDLLVYGSVVGIFAFAFVRLSMHLDPDFIIHYSRYGNEFDVFAPVTSKTSELKYFYQKLYYGVSGTYYTPNIKLEFYMFSVAFFISIYRMYRHKNHNKNQKIHAILLSLLAVHTGLVLIGRYNQTSIVFLFPLFTILVVYSLLGLKSYPRIVVGAALLLLIPLNTLLNALPWVSSSYNDYLRQISTVVSREDPTLGNLNAEFYFENGKLFDYRNLSYLKENDIRFEDYIVKNGIKYIIYSEELDLIYRLRPTWNGIYGNLTYLEEMRTFINEKCDLVHQFTDRTYGVRIVRYINTDDWKIKIYRVSANLQP